MSLEQHNETTLTQIIRIRNMTAAGQTFGTCARNGIAVTAFGLGAKQLGNFPLTDQSPTISLGADTPVCSR